MIRLGQHFLKNKSKIKKIVEALELENGDTVIEIGPGHGEITTEIRNKKLENRIIAIEKDKKLANSLQLLADRNFKSQIEVINGDALKILPELSYKLQVNSYKLCGNIPYYITGRLLRILSELENKPSPTVLTIQKEVARRIMALKPSSLNSYGRACPVPNLFWCGVRIVSLREISRRETEGQRPEARDSHAMNLLAAITQYWAEPKIIGYISKKDFKPAPKVDSAIIRLSPRNNADYTRIDADKYYKFVKILFKQPRKTIANNLRLATNDLQQLKKKIQSVGVNPNDRPQNLTLEQIKRLSTLF